MEGLRLGNIQGKGLRSGKGQVGVKFPLGVAPIDLQWGRRVGPLTPERKVIGGRGWANWKAHGRINSKVIIYRKKTLGLKFMQDNLIM